MNVTALVDASGKVIERTVYDAYGKPTFYVGSSFDTPSDTSSVANEVLFCGYRWDDETGLYQVRHRMHDPLTGRWIQTDPGGYAEGMNRYQYCRSQPHQRVDPFGNASNCIDADTLDDWIAHSEEQIAVWEKERSDAFDRGSKWDVMISHWKVNDWKDKLKANIEKRRNACNKEGDRSGWVIEIVATPTNILNPTEREKLWMVLTIGIGAATVVDMVQDKHAFIGSAIIGITNGDFGLSSIEAIYGLTQIDKLRMEAGYKYWWVHIQCVECKCRSGRLQWLNNGGPKWKQFKFPTGTVVRETTFGMNEEDILKDIATETAQFTKDLCGGN